MTRRQMIGIAGSIALALGTLSPMLAGGNGLTLAGNSGLVLILSGAALVLSVMNVCGRLWIFAAASVSLASPLPALRASMGGASGMSQMPWGAVLMVIGAGLLIAATLIKDPSQQAASTPSGGTGGG